MNYIKRMFRKRAYKKRLNALYGEQLSLWDAEITFNEKYKNMKDDETIKSVFDKIIFEQEVIKKRIMAIIEERRNELNF